MAKKQTKPTPAGALTWFPTLENLPPYHTVRLPEEGLSEIIQLWESPGTRKTMERVWRSLFQDQQRYARRLAECDWGQESSHQLVWWAVAYGSLRHGLDTFLPSPYDGLPLPVRQWLYTHALLPLDEQAFLPVKRVMAIWQALPYVRTEIAKRAKQQLGSPAGALLFIQDLVRVTKADPMNLDLDVNDLAVQAIKKLRRSTWRTAAARTKQALPHTPDDGHRSELQAHLSGAIWKTITEKWGNLQGLDAIARALDGQMRIAPTAITDDIMGDLRHIFPSAAASYTEEIPATETKPKKRRRHYVAEIPIPGDGPSDPHKLNAEEQAARGDWLRVSITEHHDERIDLARLKPLYVKFLSEHPKHQDGLALYLYDGPLTQKQQAKAQKITVQTLIHRKNRAVDAFRQWVRLGS